MSKSKFGVVSILLSFAATNALAWNTWSGKAGNGSFNDPRNWNGGNPAYLDLSNTDAKGTTEAGVDWDSNVSGMPAGTYTLEEDIVINRFNFDGKRSPILNLKGHTLTSLGKVSQVALGFRGTSLATGSSLVLTNGTFLVPESPYAGYDLKNNWVTLGYNQEGYPNEITLTVTGKDTLLKAPKVLLSYGTNNTLAVENGAMIESVVKIGDVPNVGHALKIDGGTYKYMGSDDYIGIGCHYDAVSNTLVLANGGKILDKNGNPINVFKIGAVEGTFGHRMIVRNMGTITNVFEVGSSKRGGRDLLVIEGESTVVITNRPYIPSSSCPESGIKVCDGATLVFDGEQDSMKRFWLGNGVSNAFVLVTGAGSYMENKGSTTLIGQGGSRASVRVTDGAKAKFAAMTVNPRGQDACNSHALFVDDGGEVEVAGTLASGGINESEHNEGEFSMSNRFVVATGGKLKARQINIGQRSYSRCNSLDVSGTGSSVSVTENILVGLDGDGKGGGLGNGISVSDGATLSIANTLRTIGPESWIKVDGGAISCGGSAILTNSVSIAFNLTESMDMSVPAISVEKGITVSKEATISVTGGLRADADDKYYLLNAKGALTIPDAVVQNLKATLPETLSLHKTASSLYVQNRRGLLLIFR